MTSSRSSDDRKLEAEQVRTYVSLLPPDARRALRRMRDTIRACGAPPARSGSMEMDAMTRQEFATRYTAAWCSQKPASVAAFFAEGGSLTINDGTPSVGRAAIAAAAQGFMSAFPDMIVRMDRLDVNGDRGTYHWTFTGMNTGPGGTGKAVRFSGYEEWRFGADGLIAESKGHFDEAEYERQLKEGVTGR